MGDARRSLVLFTSPPVAGVPPPRERPLHIAAKRNVYEWVTHKFIWV
ncbi:hypothetical protein FACS189499_08180 [Clostridia bacterium]|nr:hypothetical protein FACS189499_08180 [Clostridia bacterium]